MNTTYLAGLIKSAQINCSRIVESMNCRAYEYADALACSREADIYNRKFQYLFATAIYNLDTCTYFDETISKINCLVQMAYSADIELFISGVCDMDGWLYKSGPIFPINKVELYPSTSYYTVVFVAECTEFQYAIDHLGNFWKGNGLSSKLLKRPSDNCRLDIFDENVYTLLNCLRYRWL